MSAKFKMWAKIIFAFLVALCTILIWLLMVRRKSVVTIGTSEFKDKLEKARTEAAMEIGIARGKEEAVREEVLVIQQIDDRAERLKRLSDLVNRTSR